MNLSDPQTVEYVRKASRQLVREWGFLSGCPNESGLPGAQAHALIELSEQGALNVKALAGKLLVDESTASRMAKVLSEKGLIRLEKSELDQRAKSLVITKKGSRSLDQVDEYANKMVNESLALLSQADRKKVEQGLHLYAKALSKRRKLQELTLRPIKRSDNPQVGRIIRSVMTEFGVDGQGFAIHDEEVDRMYETYHQSGSYYLVAEKNEEVIGGAGLGPLSDGPKGVCELRKMYLYPKARGFGLGKIFLARVLEKASELGYRRCYIETHSRMHAAQQLYLDFGFERISNSMGKTGHFGCDRWFVKDLKHSGS